MIQTKADEMPTTALEPQSGTENYWHALIDTKEAAAFLGLSPRRLEGLRYLGDSPKFLSLSPRCLRYRRIDLREWAEARSHRSTSEGERNARAAFWRGSDAPA